MSFVSIEAYRDQFLFLPVICHLLFQSFSLFFSFAICHLLFLICLSPYPQKWYFSFILYFSLAFPELLCYYLKPMLKYSYNEELPWPVHLSPPWQPTRQSSIVQLFVPLRFAIIFYSKIFGIESFPRWGECRVRGSLFHRFNLLPSSTTMVLKSGARQSTFRCYFSD